VNANRHNESARLFQICLLILACGIFTFACQKQKQIASPQPWETLTLFDELLVKPGYSNSIVQAEQELPTDEWVQEPFKHNASRSRREAAIADQVLAEIRPRLKSMNITNLVKSFKLISLDFGYITNNFGGVAQQVYTIGNAWIVNEIKSRPTNELQMLRFLGNDTAEIYGGPQGFPMSLKDRLDEILDDLRREGLTNNPIK
jgi:hypothetical protein